MTDTTARARIGASTRHDVSDLRGTAVASLSGGVLALGSVVIVLVGEAGDPDAFMSSTGAKLAGMTGFVGACLLVVGLLGLAVRYVPVLGRGARTALGVLGFATAVTAGSAATLALVVPYIVEDLPALGTNPPAVVPPSFILSGVVMGVCGIVLAVALRRASAAPRWATTLLMVGSVVTMLPLPSRFFLLAIAVGALVLASPRQTR